MVSSKDSIVLSLSCIYSCICREAYASEGLGVT
jgi:hypothetical protein